MPCSMLPMQQSTHINHFEIKLGKRSVFRRMCEETLLVEIPNKISGAGLMHENENEKPEN